MFFIILTGSIAAVSLLNRPIRRSQEKLETELALRLTLERLGHGCAAPELPGTLLTFHFDSGLDLLSFCGDGNLILISAKSVNSPMYMAQPPHNAYVCCFIKLWFTSRAGHRPAKNMEVNAIQIDLWRAMSAELLILCSCLFFHRYTGSKKKRLCCDNCSYSLVGNRSGVCPECGTPILRERQEAVSAVNPARQPADHQPPDR